MSGGPNESPNADTVQAWSEQASHGDVPALERLLWAHRDRLAGFLVRKIGPDWRGRIEPDDIIQEAYVEVFQKIATFLPKGEDAFYHWATRIIEHKFIDRVRHLRRKKRDATRESKATGRERSRHEAFLEQILRDSLTPSRAMRREDAVNALMTCIAKLSDEYRMVVQRFLLNEEPLAAIAADMGRSEDAVRRMASRAVEKLAACLESASRYLSSHD